MVAKIEVPVPYNQVSFIEELLAQVQTRAITKHAYHTVVLDQNVSVLDKVSTFDTMYNYLRVVDWKCYSGYYLDASGNRKPIESDTAPITIRLNNPATTPIALKKNMVLRAPFTKIFFEYSQFANPAGLDPQYAEITLFFGMNVVFTDEVLLQQILTSLQTLNASQAVYATVGELPSNVLISSYTPTFTHIIPPATSAYAAQKITIKVDAYAADSIALVFAPYNASHSNVQSIYNGSGSGEGAFMRLDPGESIMQERFIGSVWASKMTANSTDPVRIYCSTVR